MVISYEEHQLGVGLRNEQLCYKYTVFQISKMGKNRVCQSREQYFR